MPDFTGLFTPSGAIAFVAGIIARRIWCFAKNKYLDRVHPEDAPHRDALKTIILAWGVTLAAIAYIGVQTESTYVTTVTLVKRVAWDQYYAGKERCALTDWLALVVSPPQNIFNLHTTDPDYQNWARGVNRDYLNKLDSIGADRRKVSTEQPKTMPPILDQTCGK